MRLWREVSNDRLSGGVLYALLLLTFVFQFALTGRAAAAMITLDAAEIICASSPADSHRPAEPDRRHECPCAQLCGSGAQLPVSLPPVDTAGIPIRFADRVESVVARSEPIPFRPVTGPHPARGPPSVSIRS